MKKVRVIEDLCISCGACEGASDAFELINGLSTPIDEVVTKENEDSIMAGADVCPTDAIEIYEEN